jgi:hypothetical protein
VVTDVQWSPLDVGYGDPVQFQVVVSNQTVVSTLSPFVARLLVDGRVMASIELPRLTGNSSHTFLMAWPNATVDPTTAHNVQVVVDSRDDVHEEDESNNTYDLGAAGFAVQDTFVLEVEAVGGSVETFGQPIYSSDDVALFRARVSRGSSLTMPVTPADGLEVRITCTKEGQWYFDEATGQLVQAPPTVIFDNDLMAFNPALLTFESSIDLALFGTGNYSLRITATDGVDTAVDFTPMTVVQRAQITVETDKAVYQRGETIRVTGRLTTQDGTPLPGEKIQLLLWKGWPDVPGIIPAWAALDPETRRVSVRTDFDGYFVAVFTPLYGDTGHYSIDAVVTSTVMGDAGHAQVSILGLDLAPHRLRVETSKNSTYSKTLVLENVSGDALTGLQWELVDADPADNVTATPAFAPPASLGPDASAAMTLTVTVPEDAPDAASFTIRVWTNEGASDEATVRFEFRPAEASPVLGPAETRVGLNPGGLLARSLTLTNRGMGTMTGIAVLSPPTLPWVTVTGLAETSLAPGASAVLTVLITPPEGLAPGIYVDRVTVTDGEHTASALLTVEVTPATRGSVSFIVTDDVGRMVDGADFTLVSREAFTVQYGDGSSSTYHNVYHAQTDAAGVATLTDIPVGDYEFAVTAAGRETVRDVVGVMPQSQPQIVTIEMATVPLSYTWTVTPIIIEDTYDITLNMTFMAEVPKPEFAFLPPWVSVPHLVDDGFVGQVTVINPSRIRLDDITVRVVGADGITLSSGGNIGSMAAHPADGQRPQHGHGRRRGIPPQLLRGRFLHRLHDHGRPGPGRRRAGLRRVDAQRRHAPGRGPCGLPAEPRDGTRRNQQPLRRRDSRPQHHLRGPRRRRPRPLARRRARHQRPARRRLRHRPQPERRRRAHGRAGGTPRRRRNRGRGRGGRTCRRRNEDRPPRLARRPRHVQRRGRHRPRQPRARNQRGQQRRHAGRIPSHADPAGLHAGGTRRPGRPAIRPNRHRQGPR